MLTHPAISALLLVCVIVEGNVRIVLSAQKPASRILQLQVDECCSTSM